MERTLRVSLAVSCLSIHVHYGDINHSKGDSLLLAFPSPYHVNALWYLVMFHADITRPFYVHVSSIILEVSIARIIQTDLLYTETPHHICCLSEQIGAV